MTESLSVHSAALIVLGVVTLLGHLTLAVDFFLGARRLKRLSVLSPQRVVHAPLTIVVPARNEARQIETAVRSLLAQDYPAPFEIIVVDDRSEDATGAIIDRLASTEPRLVVCHITELPSGWLGKNHALHIGAHAAAEHSELILFVDADSILRADTVRRAVDALVSESLDQLSLLPDLPLPNPWLEAFASVFGVNFMILLRPWKAQDADSERFIGIGAFTLLRREVYRAIGGHRPIAMRPDDDIMLGRLVKRAGYRQTLMLGAGLLSVEWYVSLREMIDGLMKNAFAGLGYRVSRVLGASLAQALGNVWPYLALVFSDGWVWALNATIVVVISVFFALALHAQRAAIRWRAVIGVPVYAMLLIYIACRATWLTLRDGGIRWRGTFYRLADLKRNRL